MTHNFKNISIDLQNLSLEDKAVLFANFINFMDTSEKEKTSQLLKTKGVLLNVYENPTPVAVAIIRVATENGIKLLSVIRNIEPKKGGTSFPGGYVDKNETFEEAASRETNEECNILLDSNKFKIFKTRITPTNNVLGFCLYDDILNENEIDFSFISNETQKLLLIDKDAVLCFPTHQYILEVFSACLFDKI